MNIELLKYIQELLDSNKLVFEDSLDEVSFDMDEKEIAKLVKLYDPNVDLTNDESITKALQTIMEGVVDITVDYAKKEMEHKS